jgi:hypothetical protein
MAYVAPVVVVAMKAEPAMAGGPSSGESGQLRRISFPGVSSAPYPSGPKKKGISGPD